MTPQVLLNNLAQLEQELQSIKSARVMAEETIQAYSDVKKDIKKLLFEFSSVSSSLNSLARSFENENQTLSDEIQNTINVVKGQLETLNAAFANQCNSVILKFMESINSAADSLKNKTQSLSTKYESNNKVFKERIDELSAVQGSLVRAAESVMSLKSDISVLQKELNESQEDQDKSLEKIALDLEKTGNNHTQILTQIANELKSSQDAQDEDLASIKNTLPVLETKVLTAIQGNENKLDVIIHDLSDQTSLIETRVTGLETTLKEVSSSVKMSKILIIINIVASLLIALFVLLK